MRQQRPRSHDSDPPPAAMARANLEMQVRLEIGIGNADRADHVAALDDAARLTLPRLSDE